MPLQFIAGVVVLKQMIETKQSERISQLDCQRPAPKDERSHKLSNPATM